MRVYTGMHDARVRGALFKAWTAKLDRMRQAGAVVVTRPLAYDPVSGRAREKGIDVRIALDLVRMGRKGQFDVAVIVSQDQDLREAVDELYDIALEYGRWMKIASAFVEVPGKRQRGIDRTDWIRISPATYARNLERSKFYGETGEESISFLLIDANQV